MENGNSCSDSSSDGSFGMRSGAVGQRGRYTRSGAGGSGGKAAARRQFRLGRSDRKRGNRRPYWHGRQIVQGRTRRGNCQEDQRAGGGQKRHYGGFGANR